jgi:hypothetical protein
VGAGKAGPSNRLAVSALITPLQDAASVEAEEVPAGLVMDSAGPLTFTLENALPMNAYGQPILLYAAPTVPRKAWEAFTSHSSYVLSWVVTTPASGGQEYFTDRQELLTSASLLLHSSSDPDQAPLRSSAALGRAALVGGRRARKVHHLSSPQMTTT